jgi:hypothetical protein
MRDMNTSLSTTNSSPQKSPDRADQNEMAAPRCFLSPPSSKCLHRLRVIWCLTLHEVHSRRRTTFLVCGAERVEGAMRATTATSVKG